VESRVLPGLQPEVGDNPTSGGHLSVAADDRGVPVWLVFAGGPWARLEAGPIWSPGAFSSFLISFQFFLFYS
jgi:hypothetical protein